MRRQPHPPVKSPRRRSAPVRFPRRTPGWILLLAGLAACGPDTPPLAVDPESWEPTPASWAWVGTFVGAGEGSLGGMDTSWPRARLTIRLAPDSLASPPCPHCLAVRFEDSLFTATRVDPANDVELTVVRAEGDGSRMIRLLRYSGGGQVGNVLRVRYERRGGGGQVADFGEFLMERR